MQLNNPHAEIHVPDGLPVDAAVARTTHMAVGAHQDDIPVMAHHGILDCFGRSDRWFLGVTVTNGASSPRSGIYADVTDAEMRVVRNAEERKAAVVGEYGAAVLLDYSSADAKHAREADIVDDLTALFAAATPAVVYTHNLADRHDTHVAVVLRTITALRRLPETVRPQTLYGCEVWRDLDWLTDADKVALDVTEREHLAAALIGVYDSQIAGGKRYDRATAGRRLANATFSESHAIDTAGATISAMDLTPLIADDTIDPANYVDQHIARLREETIDRIRHLSSGGG
jgi:LmbE family N-acetylglucosaminyl deacetylase